MEADCYIDFQDVLNEHLKTPEAQKIYEEKKEIFNFEVEFNKQLQNAGYKDLCVQIIDIDDY